MKPMAWVLILLSAFMGYESAYLCVPAPPVAKSIFFALMIACVLFSFWNRRLISSLLIMCLGFSAAILLAAMRSESTLSSPAARLYNDFQMFRNATLKGGCKETRSRIEMSQIGDPYSAQQLYKIVGNEETCEIISIGPDGIIGGPHMDLSDLWRSRQELQNSSSLILKLVSPFSVVKGDAVLKCSGRLCQ